MRVRRPSFLRGFIRRYRLERQIYSRVYAQSIDATQMNDYWDQEAKAVSWFKDYASVFDGKDVRFPDYFKGGELNVCFNAVDRHLDDLGDYSALIYESQPLGIRKEITFSELHQNVCKMAFKMKQLGIEKGDRILLYMPMIPEAVYTMLAAARLGAPHVVVFGGFAAKELASRIEDSTPKLIVTASHGFEPSRAIKYEPLLIEALELTAHSVSDIILFDRSEYLLDKSPTEDKLKTKFGQNLHDMEVVMNGDLSANNFPECVSVGSSHELYILHTSGTTGKPKGVVRDSGGHLVSLLHSMKHFMQCRYQDKKEVYFAASDIGWVVGHSFSVYGPLLNGNTSVIYEGKPISFPFSYLRHQDTNKTKYLWSILDDNRVSKLFIAPTALRAIRAQDPELLNFSSSIRNHLKTIYVAGERCDPDTVSFFTKQLGIPVVDNFWQTETGSPIIGYQDKSIGTLFGSCGLPIPGFNLKINGNGDLAVKLPLPPGCLTTIHNDRDRYIREYLSVYEGYYNTGDVATVDDTGYISVMSRTTDIINTAGHRLSTGLLEQVISSHKNVLECAVVGQEDEIKGHMPFAFVVANEPTENLLDEVQLMIREEIGSIAHLKSLLVVKALPKTRSGKVLRGTLQKILNNKGYDIPATIEDIDVLGEIAIAINT